MIDSSHFKLKLSYLL